MADVSGREFGGAEKEPKPAIPRDAIPLVVGAVTVMGESVRITEETSGARYAFTCVGDEDNSARITALLDEYGKNPGAVLYTFLPLPDGPILDNGVQLRGRMERTRVAGVAQAIRILRTGTTRDAATIELVTSGDRVAEIDPAVAPAGTALGDIVGLWFDNRIGVQDGSGKAALVAAHNVTRNTTSYFPGAAKSA